MHNDREAWYQDWFNEDYLKLYEYRNTDEAEKHLKFLEKNLSLLENAHILDLGCGIGRHSILFADNGYTVVGVDASPTFIQEAQRSYSPDRKLKFCLRDMRYLEELGKFDVVISMFTSFGYFEDDEDNRKVIRSIFYALKSKGKFFLDFLNPSYVIENLVPNEEKKIDGERVIITRKVSKDKVMKKIEFPTRTYHEQVKLYDKKQIETMLIAEGFEILESWGDYDESPLSEGSPRQLILSQKVS